MSDEEVAIPDVGTPAVSDAGTRGPGWLPGLLVVLATVLAVVSTMTTWVHSQALDTDEWVEVSDRLLAEPEVRDALSVYLADQLFTAVDLQSELEAVLPEALAGLAGPIAGAVRAPATDGIERLVASDRFGTLWEEANRTAHQAVVSVLRGGSIRNISTSDGTVVLDLGAALRTVGQDIGIPESALDKIPPDAGQVTIFESDELADIQTGVKVLDFISWFLFIVVVALYALAVFLAVGRRRRMLRNVGFGLVIGGFVLLMVRTVSIRTSVDLFVEDATRQPLARVVGSVMTELLREMAWTGIVYGILIVAFTALLGEHRWAVSARRSVAGATDSTIAIVGFVVVVLLVWWSPGRAFDRWVTALTLVGLVVGGVVTFIAAGRRELNDVNSHPAESSVVADL